MRFRFDGHELHRRRMAAGLKPARLAADADISVGSLSSYEIGRVIPRSSVVARLAEVLGCTPGDLFVDDGPDAVERLVAQRAEQGLPLDLTDAAADDTVELLSQGLK